MKNLKKVIGILLVMVLAFSMVACNGNVKADAEKLKADVTSYVETKEGSLSKLEGELTDKYNELKKSLQTDVAASKYFAVGAKDELIAKSDQLVEEAKNITVDNPEVKKLHDELIAAYEEKSAALKRLVASIDSGVQADYEVAKEDVDKAFAKVEELNKKIKDML